jgi:hypothetical protein
MLPGGAVASTPAPHACDCEHDDEDENRMAELAHQAARSEYRILLATMPLWANPMQM